MIESVYSNDNTEANQTDMVQTSFKMPKNIRQIGKSTNARKIYIEDYVMTFAKQLAGEDYSTCRVAVLVGQYAKLEQGRCLFISGAVEVEGIDVANGIAFTNDHWTSIYENIKKYFVNTEIVGWFIGGPGYLLEDKERILKAHIDNFAGQDKTLLTYDNMEKEEAFYFYENGVLGSQSGYYIYYEKNEDMQTYMIESKGKPSEEEQYDDRVSREIRTILQNKKPTEESKSISRLMYGAGTLLAVIILVVGAAMLSNYDQMKTMQSTLDSLYQNLKEVESVFLRNENNQAMSNAAKEQVVDKPIDTEESLDVVVVPGGVSPLPDVVNEDDIDNKSDENNINSDNGQQNGNKGSSETVEDDFQETITGQKADDNAAEEEVKYYIVKAGDSLAGISYRLYNSANYISKIKQLNNIEDENMIYIGQKLILP